jgi:hypothetical protein
VDDDRKHLVVADYEITKGSACHRGEGAAAKVLCALLDKLRAASARGRRGGLAVVRAMSSREPGT